MSVLVSLIQFDVSYGNPEKNKNKVANLIGKAMERKPDIIVLPELWTTGYDLTRLDEIADENAEDTEKFIGDMARQYEVNIVAGSVAKKTNENVTNTMFTFDRSGAVVSEYSKVHLFRLMDEEKYLTAGDSKGLFTLEDFPCASAICYDIRFSEWIRVQTLKGAGVLFVPAEWPAPRTDHWRTLLLSRAIENQCFVVACNRVGNDPKNEFGGHSIIIGPWGEIIAEAGDHEEILHGEIDINEVEEIRKKIPVFEDRRPDLYR